MNTTAKEKQGIQAINVKFCPIYRNKVQCTARDVPHFFIFVRKVIYLKKITAESADSIALSINRKFMSIGIVNKSDTPWRFTKDIQQDNWHIQYTDLNEICQGGPLVGSLIVNGQKVFCDKRFGGPLLCCKNLAFIPMYIRKFYASGFMLSVIELNSMRLGLIKGIYDLVYLDSIDEDEILFYQDRNRNKSLRKKIDNKRLNLP